MVEQRSPKPSVACSSRVSPAKASVLLRCGSFLFLELTLNGRATFPTKTVCCVFESRLPCQSFRAFKVREFFIFRADA